MTNLTNAVFGSKTHSRSPSLVSRMEDGSSHGESARRQNIGGELGPAERELIESIKPELRPRSLSQPSDKRDMKTPLLDDAEPSEFFAFSKILQI